jgi:hypothetical protein
MSGGSWEHFYGRLQEVADRLEEDRNPLRRAFGAHLQLCVQAMHDIEWVDSADYGVGADVASIKAVVAPTRELDEAVEDARIMIERLCALLKRAKK